MVREPKSKRMAYMIKMLGCGIEILHDGLCGVAEMALAACGCGDFEITSEVLGELILTTVRVKHLPMGPMGFQDADTYPATSIWSLARSLPENDKLAWHSFGLCSHVYNRLIPREKAEPQLRRAELPHSQKELARAEKNWQNIECDPYITDYNKWIAERRVQELKKEVAFFAS